MEKSNDLIGNRTRYLPACSIVPQPNTLPRGFDAREIGVHLEQRKEMFLFSAAYRLILKALGTEGVSPKLKRQRREADYSSPSSAGDKNGGAIPPLTIYLHVLMLNNAAG
jgi:hypothetical protein